MSEIRVNKITNRSGLGTITVSDAGAIFSGEKTGFGTDNPRYTLEVGAVGAGGTQLWVNGDARVTGIMSIGQGTITLDPDSNMIKLGALTMHRDSVTGDALLMSTNGEYNPFRASKFLIDATEVIDNNRNFTGVDANFSGNVSVGGTLTYEDVTNIDSVGLITARNGLHVTGGNLGIGDANPSNELVVKSGSTPTIEINGQGRVLSLTLGVTANESKLFEGSNNALAFGTNNTERLRINSSGNIGIGTDNPATKVHIESGTPYIRSKNTGAPSDEKTWDFNAGTDGILRFRNINDAANSANNWLEVERNGVQTNSIRLLTGSGAERLRITSDGNITFGNQSASTGNNSSTLVHIDAGREYWSGLPGDYRALKHRMYYVNADDAYGMGISASLLEIQSQTAIGFFAGTAGASSGRRLERLRINSAGEVYIGSSTANGQGKLFVNDSSGTTTTRVHIRNAVSTGNAETYYNLDSTKFASVGLENGSLVFRNSTSSTPTERLRITSGGDTELRNVVGVISNSYSQYLKFRTTQTNGQSAVTGAIRAQGVSSWGGDLAFYSKPANGSPNDTVTERLRITSAGDVGIGTDNPQANLHIFEGTGSTQAPANSAKNIIIDGNGAVGMSLLFGTSANTAYGNIYWGNSTDGPSDGRITYFGSTYATASDRQSMVFRTAGTEKLRITSDGAVNLPQQPRFFAYGTSSINMTTTGYHTWATFTNTRFNVGNDFSTSTKIFTAPVDGTYAFGCNCRIDAGSVGYFRIILSINGSSADNEQAHSIRNSDSGNSSYHSQEITALYQLSANDNVRVIVESNSDSSWTMQSESQFWGYLVA